MIQSQLLGLWRMSRDIDFGCTSSGRQKWSVQLAALDATILSRKVHLAVVAPESVTDGQVFFGARVSFVVRQEISVATLLFRRAAGDDVECQASTDRSRQSVNLLHEYRWLHQAESIRYDEFQFVSQLPHGRGDQNCIGLVI